MKITKQTFPILEKLSNRKLGVVGFYQDDYAITKNIVQVEKIKHSFNKNVNAYNSEISLMTQPFNDAIYKSFSSLICDDVWNDIGNKSGTILNMQTPFGVYTVCYNFKGLGDKGHHIKDIFYFENGVFIGRSTQSKTNFDCCYSLTLLERACKWFDVVKFELNNSISFSDRNQVINEIDNILNTFLIANINFIKYASIETKILKPRESADEINCKYINDSKSTVRVLNSTWFTNLIKSDAFNVRGHFRLQPCGDGYKDKKLIWINGYEKKGYIAKARKLLA